jgi:translation initiation factor IF-1
MGRARARSPDHHKKDACNGRRNWCSLIELDDWPISRRTESFPGALVINVSESEEWRRFPASFQPRMSNEEPIQVEGTIATVLPGTMFRVKLDNQHELLAHLSGKMRKHFVRLTVGDRVRLEMSPYDLTKARITYRLK